MTIACFIAKVMLDFYKFSIAGKRAGERYNAIRRGQGFLSTQNRFAKGKAPQMAPGPGAYRHQEGMIKRSFNVTIDI